MKATVFAISLVVLLVGVAPADSLNVRFIGSCDTRGAAYGVDVSGSYAYVAAAAYGLRVISIDDPEHPVEVGYYDTPGTAYGVAVSGNYACVAAASAGLRVISIADPANPVEVGFHDSLGSALGVAVSGSYAYVAYDFYGLRVISIPGAALIGYNDTLGEVRGVAVSGSLPTLQTGIPGCESSRFPVRQIRSRSVTATRLAKPRASP